jgi:hypothetical protein
MIVYDGEIYFDEKQIEPVNELHGYAKALYFAIAKTLDRNLFGISRRKAAQTIQLSVRHLYRKIARFKEEGLPGLIHRSRRPKTSPKKTSLEEEDRILKIREASGFGPKGIALLAKESFQRENKTKQSSHQRCTTSLSGKERSNEKEGSRTGISHLNGDILTDRSRVILPSSTESRSSPCWTIIHEKERQ